MARNSNQMDEEEYEDIVVPEAEETTEDVVEFEPEVNETDWKAEALKQKGINARLAKKLEHAPKEQTQSTNTAEVLSRDEAILLAQGMSEEDLDKLSIIAKGNGQTLLEAKKDELFVAYLEKKELEAKKEKAKLGSSKGSTSTQSVEIKDLSDDEHKALVKERMANVR